MKIFVVAQPDNFDKVGLKTIPTDSAEASKYLLETLTDQDAKALYPSLILALNMSPETCYGRIEIMNDENMPDNDKTKDFVDGIISKDYVNLSNEWFNTPHTEELINKFKLILNTI